MSKSLKLIEAASAAALKTAVDTALAIPAPVAAVPRIVRVTAIGIGTQDAILTIGGLVVNIGNNMGDDVAIGADAAGLAANLRAFINTNKASIPAPTVSAVAAAHFDITYTPGVNTSTLTENDPFITAVETQAGADEIVTGILAGGVNVRVSRGRTGAGGAFEDTIHYGQTLQTVRP